MKLDHHIELGSMNGALLALAQQVIDHHRPQFGEFDLRETFPGSPHSDTASLYLRAPPWPMKDARAVQEDLRVVDWPALQLDDRFRQVLLTLQNTVQLMMARAMVVTLKPGGSIARHKDEGLYAQSTERFHYPVVTNPGVLSTIGDETFHMTAGSVWWYNKDELHSAVNNSDQERVHIIFDCWKA